MKQTWLKDKNAPTIAACLVALLLVYAVDAFPLSYRLSSWDSLGPMSVAPARLLYLVADTPDVIGYIEKDAGERVECATVVAYVETDSGETYRCCQAETRVSCVAGDFASDIPPADPACAQTLGETFGVPASLPGAKDYLVYGVCPEGGNPELTVAQIDASGEIQWKTLAMFEIGVVNGVLRCILGPALAALALRAFIQTRRKPDPDRQIRKW